MASICGARLLRRAGHGLLDISGTETAPSERLPRSTARRLAARYVHPMSHGHTSLPRKGTTPAEDRADSSGKPGTEARHGSA